MPIPQGYDVLGDILRVINLHEQRKSKKHVEKLQTEEFKQRQLEFKEEQARQKERIAQEERRIGLEKERVDIDVEARRLLAQKHDIEQRQELQKAAVTGVLASTPGWQSEPQGGIEAPFSPRLGVLDPQATQVKYKGPAIGQATEPTEFTAPSPTAYAKFQAGIKDIGEESTRAFELQKQSELSEQKLKEARTKELFDLLENNKKRRDDAEKERLNRESEEKRTGMTSAATRYAADQRLKAAQLAADKANKEVEMNLEPIAQRIEDLEISGPEFAQLEGLTPSQKGRIQKRLIEKNVNFGTPNQKAVLGEIGGLKEMLIHMDTIAGRQANWGGGVVGGMIGGLTKANDPVMQTAEDEQKALTTKAARIFAKDVGNTSVSDEQRVQGFFLSKWKPLSSNIKLRNDFLERYRQELLSRLHGLSQSQVDRVMERAGLAGPNAIKPIVTDSSGRIISGLTSKSTKPLSSPTKQQNQSQQQLLRQTPTPQPAPGGSPIGQQVPGQGLSPQELQQRRQNEVVFNPNKRYRIVSTTGESGVYQGNDPVLQRLYRNLRGLNRLGAISEEGGSTR